VHRFYQFLTAVLLACFIAGCPSRDPLPTKADPQVCAESWKDVPVGVNRALDLLFVIDNSGSMGEEQASLIANFHRFVAVLENVEGGLPDLHIGIVSTDMGVGRFDAIQNCTDSGDQGLLQAIPRDKCEGPDGNFIIDVLDPDGSRRKNYSGELSDAFGCIARLGVNGCGFEQPLASMRKALDGSVLGNVGFLRDNAALMVVFITDEDDCSVPGDALFDTASSTVDDPLGPMSSFRCFEFGVECSPDTPRRPGVYNDCRAREDSELVDGIEQYVSFLKGLKRDPSMVTVAGIIGDASPVVVENNNLGEPGLTPSCVSNSGIATPAVRLQQFIDKFPNRGTATTICNDDLSDALLLIARNLAVTLSVPCLEGDIDTDPDTPGLQYECSVSDVRFVGQDNQDEIALPECPNEAPAENQLPCWRLQSSPDLCTDTPSQSTIVVERGEYPAPSSFVRIRCLEASCSE